MSGGLILAIDQGTTNTKALAVDSSGRIVAQASAPMNVSYPKPGWAEQSALDIWSSVRRVIAEVMAQTGPDIDAIAISNQRETIVAWDATTGAPLAPAITWQCRRSTERCEAIRAAGHAGLVEQKTGLGLDPLFPAAKIGWLIENVEDVRSATERGTLRVGTVDAWLLFKLTAGAVHATDHSNASRTQLLDTDTLTWDNELLAIFGVPSSALPRVMPSNSHFGDVAAGATALTSGTPIHAMLGDSHAALFGHGVRAPGTVKATYGTGSSLMTLTSARRRSTHGLSATIAWSTTSGGAVHALEGNISVSGQAAAFMSELLGIQSSEALAGLATSVPDSNGVSFVPALVGLGAPHWAPDARGLVTGLSLGTRPAHLARAAIEAIAQQVADVFEAMQDDLGAPLAQLSADGGASRNDALMQFQADIIARPVIRGAHAEVSALGATMMAAQSLGRTVTPPASAATFEPTMAAARRDSIRAGWRDAVGRALWQPQIHKN
ncbi:MAG: glycerol kinase [Hyphomicrobiales bacterium]|nr:MAG: glycerol kinase [Hyphomicrobiales bacterium]